MSSGIAKTIFIPEGISSTSELFKIYSRELNFPSYFGNNWNAFDDCLTDLGTDCSKDVVIIHKDIPFNGSDEERLLYIESLFDAVKFWMDYPEHKFYVYFPENCRAETQVIQDKIKGDS
ncbi:MAG: barstar family protein [Verrucomicrobia bacterium]|nr:barstar family protein [Verrucomicrobiota bacterium]